MLRCLMSAVLFAVAAVSRADPAWLVETDLPWEQVNPLPANRIEHTHFVHDGLVYLLGRKAGPGKEERIRPPATGALSSIKADGPSKTLEAPRLVASKMAV